MTYIYKADVWCDDCGRAIKESLTQSGVAPADPSNEWSYDSDDFPKYTDDDESDTPQHCAANEQCANAVEIEGGKVGLLFGELTTDGILYIEEAIEEANDNDGSSWSRDVVGLWYDHFSKIGYQFKNIPNWV